VGQDGSVYVAGLATSPDFPVTPGAYLTTFPSANPDLGIPSNFVFRLQPDGSLAWSTLFPASGTTANAIAVDGSGNPYIEGTTFGGLPTTAGAYVTGFQSPPCPPGWIGPCFPPASAFLTKFTADGSALVFSTYIPQDLTNTLIQNASALVLDLSGNVYLGGGSRVCLMNSTGSALLASNGAASITIGALALDSSLNLYATVSPTPASRPLRALFKPRRTRDTVASRRVCRTRQRVRREVGQRTHAGSRRHAAGRRVDRFRRGASSPWCKSEIPENTPVSC
jgi:hypothetical protein